MSEIIGITYLNKGRISLRKPILNGADIVEGDTLLAKVKNGEIIIRKINSSELSKLNGGK